MKEKLYYAIIDRGNVEGTNWGYFTEPGKCYLSTLTSHVIDHSTSMEWSEYISHAWLFTDPEDAWEVIYSIWNSYDLQVSVIIITQSQLDNALRDYPDYVEARAAKIEYAKEEGRKINEILRNLNRISDSLTESDVVELVPDGCLCDSNLGYDCPVHERYGV